MYQGKVQLIYLGLLKHQEAIVIYLVILNTKKAVVDVSGS